MTFTNTIRADINKATWEDTEVPAVCETCLGPNPYIRMTRERYGLECKLCTRPFTVFKWTPDSVQSNSSSVRQKPKKTTICLTCARQKNCCQSCMLDLTYGLPLEIRDTALKMIMSAANNTNGGGKNGFLSIEQMNTSSNASNAVIRQYIAQNLDAENKSAQDLEDEQRTKILKESEAARNFLKQIAMGFPQNKHLLTSHQQEQARKTAASKDSSQQEDGNSKALAIDVGKIAAKLPLNGFPKPFPKDTSIRTIFVMGIEDDLPEYVLRDHFLSVLTSSNKFDPKSLTSAISSSLCVHRSRCGFFTFKTREMAETVAQSTANSNGKFTLNGCKLRLAWSNPKSLGTTNAQHTRLGQIVRRVMKQRDLKERKAKRDGSNNISSEGSNKDNIEKPQLVLPPPPVNQKIKYKTAQSGYED